MKSAVVLAGYNNRRAVERYSRLVKKSYGEKFIETGYKPLREFPFSLHGQQMTKPLIQFTLEEIFKDDLIDDVVIVGHQLLLEERMEIFLKSQSKPWKIIAQKDPLPDEAVDSFGIDRKKMPYDSIGGNIIKGYAASRAFGKRESALLLASDSPLTTLDFIHSFLKGAARFPEDTGIILPVVPVGLHHDRMGRKSLLLLNDTGIPLSCRKDRYGRCGFRSSSLLLCNPYQFDVGRINVIYNLRKALSPKVQMEIFRICRELGYPGIYKKYFRKKNLSLRECEAIATQFLKGTIRMLPILGSETTFDYDGTKKELKKITRMLRRKT